MQEVTDRVAKEVLYEDSSDAVVVDKPLKIGLGQNSISKNSVKNKDEKTGRPHDIKKTGHLKKKKRREEREEKSEDRQK